MSINKDDNANQEVKEKPLFIMMVGLPGSGKSTAISELPRMPVISTDAIIEQMATLKRKTYSEIFQESIGMATIIADELMGELIQEKKSFILDQTNLSKKSRAKKLRKVPSVYEKRAILVTCLDPEVLAKRLNARPGKTIPEHVMESMTKAFEVPTEDEGFSQVIEIRT